MTAIRQPRPERARRLLDEVMAELRATAAEDDALGSALIAAVEGATLIAVAADEARRDGGGDAAVELAQQALGAMRASVTATTMSVWALADRRRVAAAAGSAGVPA